MFQPGVGSVMNGRAAIRRAFVVAVVSTAPAWAAPDQADGTTPRSTTERPNVSAPGLQQTVTGVLMDAGCAAITDSRSELTKTPQLVPKNPNADRSAPPSGSRSSERARTNTNTESSVPDSYRDCHVKPSTTSFAIYSDGQLYMFDRISNQMMQDRMQNARSTAADSTNSNKWSTITVVGTATSDRVLTIRSIRK